MTMTMMTRMTMTKKERRMTLVRGDYYLGSDEVGEVAKMVKHGKRLIDWLGLPLLGLPWLAWCSPGQEPRFTEN